MTGSLTADRTLHRQRAREFRRAHCRRLARCAQVELVRLGRPPGPLVGAVERLSRAQAQEAAAAVRLIVRTLLVEGIPGRCAVARLRRLGRDPTPLVSAVERLRSSAATPVPGPLAKEKCQ